MRYLQLLSEMEEILPLSVPENTTGHAWHLFIIRLHTDKAKMSRDTFMEKLKKKNIGTGLHFRAVHQQKYYRETMPLGAVCFPTRNGIRTASVPSRSFRI